MFFLDAHFHLDHLPKNDLANIIKSSLSNKVIGGISAGVWHESLDNILNLKNSNANNLELHLVYKNKMSQLSPGYFSVFYAHGLHPLEIYKKWFTEEGVINTKRIDADIKLFEDTIAANTNIIWAIGETGFDFSREIKNFCTLNSISKEKMLATQKIAVDASYALANKHQIPIILHARNAWSNTLKVLHAHENVKTMLHCYSESAQELQKLKSRPNLYFSFGGVVTWINSHKAKEAVKACPINTLLVETDAPYLPPETILGDRLSNNNSSNIPLIAECFAKIKGEEVSCLASNILNNTADFLGISSNISD